MSASAARILSLRWRASGTCRIWIIFDMLPTCKHVRDMSTSEGCECIIGWNPVGSKTPTPGAGRAEAVGHVLFGDPWLSHALASS